MREIQTFDVTFDDGDGFDLSFNGGGNFNLAFDAGNGFGTSFDSGQDFGVSLGNEQGFDADFGEISVLEIKDHRELSHRDASKQHPISAIANLVDELAVRPDTPIDDSYIDNL